MNSLFIALPLPKLIKSRLEHLCFGLPNVPWTEHSHFHLNILSLGQADGTLQLDIQEALAKIQVAPFNLSLQGVGCFRAKNKKGMIWAGVSPSKELTVLIKTITGKLNLIIPKLDKSFIPHVTLGRFGNMDEKRLFDYLDSNSSFITDSFPADCIALMKSQNTLDDRTLYQELVRFKLSPPVNKLRLFKD